jgi:hypothetical protein
MGVLAWILFNPDEQSHTLIFHIFRQAVIFSFILLSTFINPSLFTITLMLVSLIEYSRHCRSRGLISLYFVVVFGFWFSAFLRSPYHPHFALKPLFSLLFKGAVGYMAVVFDHLTVRRFGFRGKVAMTVFPFLAAGSAQFVSVLDHFGLCAHLSSFCNDYPDFTLLFLRIFGPAGPTFLVAFFASYISSWRVTRFLPRFVSVILFQFLPSMIIFVSIVQYFGKPPHCFLRTAVVHETQEFVQFSKFPSSDLFVVAAILPSNATDALLSIARETSALCAFAYRDRNQTTLAVALPNGSVVSRLVSEFEKPVTPWRLGLKELLVIQTAWGRIGFICGGEMYRPEFFAASDTDLLVTFGSPRFDEMSDLVRRSAQMISEMTGAARFHASANYEDFAVTADGIFQFRDQADGTEKAPVKEYRVKIANNLWKWSGRRLLVVEYFVIVGFFAGLALNLVPKQSAYDFTRRVSDLMRRTP